jgi:hypothetical protein
MDNTIQLLVGPGALALVGAGVPLLLSRERIEDTIELLVALLDVTEPDTDLEEIGLEDSFMAHGRDYGPGCPAADIDFGIDDERHDDDDPAEDDDPGEDNGDTELNGDEGDYSGSGGSCGHYGIDQTRPISAHNPELR